MQRCAPAPPGPPGSRTKMAAVTPSRPLELRLPTGEGASNPHSLCPGDRCVGRVCKPAEMWETFLALSAIAAIYYCNSMAYKGIRGDRLALCRTLADGVRTARGFGKCLKLERFGHVGRDGRPFSFIN